MQAGHQVVQQRQRPARDLKAAGAAELCPAVVRIATGANCDRRPRRRVVPTAQHPAPIEDKRPGLRIHRARGVDQLRIDWRGTRAGALAQDAGIVEKLGAVIIIQVELVILDIEEAAGQIVDLSVVRGRGINQAQIAAIRCHHRARIGQRPVEIQRGPAQIQCRPTRHRQVAGNDPRRPVHGAGHLVGALQGHARQQQIGDAPALERRPQQQGAT